MAENSRIEMSPSARAALMIASSTPAFGVIPTPIAADSWTSPPAIRLPINPPTNFAARPKVTTAMTNVKRGQDTKIDLRSHACEKSGINIPYAIPAIPSRTSNRERRSSSPTSRPIMSAPRVTSRPTASALKLTRNTTPKRASISASICRERARSDDSCWITANRAITARAKNPITCPRVVTASMVPPRRLRARAVRTRRDRRCRPRLRPRQHDARHANRAGVGQVTFERLRR